MCLTDVVKADMAYTVIAKAGVGKTDVVKTCFEDKPAVIAGMMKTEGDGNVW